MYPITRESVTADISSSVAENAVCWCDGRKKRSRRILRRVTHPARWRRVIESLESKTAFPRYVLPPCSSMYPVVQGSKSLPHGTRRAHASRNLSTTVLSKALTRSAFDQHNPRV